MLKAINKGLILAIMWSDIVRIFLTVVLSLAFLVFFGQKNIKRYQEGGIAKIRDEEDMLQKNMPVPGKTFIYFPTKNTFT